MSKKEKYPLNKFLEAYGTEEKCYQHMVKIRWETDFQCPKCGHSKCGKLSNGRFQCNECRHQVSVTAGTVMHRSHLPLTTWFLAIYFVSQDKQGFQRFSSVM